MHQPPDVPCSQKEQYLLKVKVNKSTSCYAQGRRTIKLGAKVHKVSVNFSGVVRKRKEYLLHLFPQKKVIRRLILIGDGEAHSLLI